MIERLRLFAPKRTVTILETPKSIGKYAKGYVKNQAAQYFTPIKDTFHKSKPSVIVDSNQAVAANHVNTSSNAVKQPKHRPNNLNSRNVLPNIYETMPENPKTINLEEITQEFLAEEAQKEASKAKQNQELIHQYEKLSNEIFKSYETNNDSFNRIPKS